MENQRRGTDETRAIDVAIGASIYKLRTSLGYTRKVFAKKIGVTHQQLHKYEQGQNRISASRLIVLARNLNVSMAGILQGIDTYQPISKPHERLAVEISNTFRKIPSVKQRLAVMSLVRSLAYNE